MSTTNDPNNQKTPEDFSMPRRPRKMTRTTRSPRDPRKLWRIDRFTLIYNLRTY